VGKTVIPNGGPNDRAVLQGLYFTPAVLGNVYYVDSVLGSSGGPGWAPENAYATIAQALAVCVANNGDEIHVLPTHNEGFADAQLTINKAGVKIKFLKSANKRGRIDFDHANASIDITANDVIIEGASLLPSVTAVLIGIDINAGVTGTILRDILTLSGEDGAGVDEFAKTIDLKAGCNQTVIEDCIFTQHASAAGVISCVALTGASDLVTIRRCEMWTAGAGVVAPINGDTTLSTRLLIEDCKLISDDEPGIELLTGTTGVIRNVDIFSNLATIAAATVADGMAHFRVRYVELGNESDAIVKTASVDD
jgi:hypothetical protein